MTTPIDTPLPPNLKDILSAYKMKGEGDREMLLAILNAKSAEDQRIAAVASLQKTMLEMQTSLALVAQQQQSRSPPPPHRARYDHPASHSPPHPRSRMDVDAQYAPHKRQRTTTATAPYPTSHSRRSSHSSDGAHSPRHVSHLPPSPRSYSSSSSTSPSPQLHHRGGMAIGNLLSQDVERGFGARTSAERSTTHDS